MPLVALRILSENVMENCFSLTLSLSLPPIVSLSLMYVRACVRVCLGREHMSVQPSVLGDDEPTKVMTKASTRKRQLIELTFAPSLEPNV